MIGSIVEITGNEKSETGVFIGRFGIVMNEFSDSYNDYLDVRFSEKCYVAVHPDDLKVVGHVDQPDSCYFCPVARRVMCANAPGHTIVCGKMNVSAYTNSPHINCPLGS